MSYYPAVTLNNGIEMPQIGLGVWNTKDGDEVADAVEAAITHGYRLIDTASVYGNETGVGQGIRRSDIAREELFITTKLWNSDQGYETTLKAFDASMKRLGVTYIDLYLIHWPMPKYDAYIDTWRAFEHLLASGKVRGIGVCNFTPEQLTRLIDHSTIVPAVNQIELHPYFPQHDTQKFCEKYGIQVESWSPIGGPGGGGARHSKTLRLLDQPILAEIGAKYGKSAAQVVIRWHIQNGLVVIPKSVRPMRIAENIDVFDFTLTNEDIEAINSLETGVRGGPNPETMNHHLRVRALQIAHQLGIVERYFR